MTVLKCILVGDIKKHIELREEDIKTYDELRAIIMKWAVNKKIEKDKGHAPMDIGAVQDEGNWGTGDDDDWDRMTGPDWEGDWTLGQYSQEGGWDVNVVGKGGKGWDNWTKGIGCWETLTSGTR